MSPSVRPAALTTPVNAKKNKNAYLLMAALMRTGREGRGAKRSSRKCRASLLAMSRAVEGLSVQPEEAIIDGNMKPTLLIHCSTLVGGDRLHRSIGAASILAKTARDAVLVELDIQFPHYGFAQHKGYATPQHLEALRRHGPCAVHRKSFSPCAPQQSLDLGACRIF